LTLDACRSGKAHLPPEGKQSLKHEKRIRMPAFKPNGQMAKRHIDSLSVIEYC